MVYIPKKRTQVVPAHPEPYIRQPNKGRGRPKKNGRPKKYKHHDSVRASPAKRAGARWITADTPAELREFMNAYPMRMAYDAADTLAYLCTSPYDVRLAQERFPKIHFHPLREHAGLALQAAG